MPCTVYNGTIRKIKLNIHKRFEVKWWTSMKNNAKTKAGMCAHHIVWSFTNGKEQAKKIVHASQPEHHDEIFRQNLFVDMAFAFSCGKHWTFLFTLTLSIWHRNTTKTKQNKTKYKIRFEFQNILNYYYYICEWFCILHFACISIWNHRSYRNYFLFHAKYYHFIL